MPYISEVPGDVVTLVGETWVLDINQNHILNGFFSNTAEITGDINATNQSGNGSIAEPGETLTVPTAGGDQVGEYVGPIVLSTENVTVGIPGVASVNVKVNDIDGHIMHAPDGSTYIITDQPVDDDHLGATLTTTILGYDIELIDVPVSELNNALTGYLNDLADSLGPILGLPIRAVADIMANAADITQTVLDLALLNTAEGTGTLEVICFVKGTLILTSSGYVPVEELRVGDMVKTRDNGMQEIRWIGSRLLDGKTLKANPKIVPIRITKGALGGNVPSADLLVSPQHRILVRSKIAQRLCSAPEVLVAAKQLVMISGIDSASDLEEVEYFHILFDRHEVIDANGAETESLFTGPEALRTVGPSARAELIMLFPQLAEKDYSPRPVRHIPSGRVSRKMVVRHIQNTKPLVEAARIQ